MGGKIKSPEARTRAYARAKAYRKEHSAQCAKCYRDANLRKHNLTQQGFDALFAQQEGVCPVCKQPLVKTVARSAASVNIDHDHSCCPGTFSCGKCIRGLLHQSCNAGLGCLGDNPETLRNAAEYLERSRR